MFQSIADFFTKMGDKNPELCLVIVFCLMLTSIFLYYSWKGNAVTQILFADYKETVKNNTNVIQTVHETLGGFVEAIRKCTRKD
jgi:hypothetical protein